MTAYTSLELTPPVYPVSGVGVGGRTTHGARGTFTLTAALALNDTIQLFDLPPRARIVSGFIKSDDLDSGGSALRMDVGIAGTTNLFFAASTAGSTASVDRALAFAGTDYITTGKTRVFATVNTGPTTGATSGTFTVVLEYFCEEPA